MKKNYDILSVYLDCLTWLYKLGISLSLCFANTRWAITRHSARQDRLNVSVANRIYMYTQLNGKKRRSVE